MQGYKKLKNGLLDLQIWFCYSPQFLFLYHLNNYTISRNFQNILENSKGVFNFTKVKNFAGGVGASGVFAPSATETTLSG